MSTVFEQLVAVADGLRRDGYLSSFEADLTVHDRKSLEQSRAGASFVWAIRECGTAMHPIAAGLDSVWLTYWLDAGNSSRAPTRCYLVQVTADGGALGNVRAITDDKARKLASKPHPDGKVVRVSMFGETGA
jgi:hypothetical protein